ncbi:MAG: hypothetical protein AABX96_03260 [Nanoarchaeota archaeon]
MTIIEHLQLRNKQVLCLKVDDSLIHLPNIGSKVRSLILIDKIEGVLLKEISTNRNLRDFLSVDIQDIGRQLYEKHRKFIASPNDNIFFFKNFGFVNIDSLKNQDESYYHYLSDLTSFFASSIEWLRGNNIINLSKNKINGFYNYLLNPLIILLKSVGVIKSQISNDEIYFDSKDKLTQDVLSAWQNKTIFERLIAKLIENELKCKTYCSKYVIINSIEPEKFSLEFDIIFVFGNKICFVELKNGEIRRNDVFEFLGKIRAVEEYYGFKVNRVAIIGTKQKEEIFNELELKNPHFRIFDIIDYRDDLKRFFSFIKA